MLLCQMVQAEHHMPKNLFLQNYQNCQRHKYTSTVSRLSWYPKVFVKSASGHTVFPELT